MRFCNIIQMCSVNTLVEKIDNILDDHVNTFKVIKQSLKDKDNIKTYIIVESLLDILKDISTIKADDNISSNFIKNIKNMTKMFKTNQNMMKQLQDIINNPKILSKETFTESLLLTMFVNCQNYDDINQLYYQKDIKLINKQEDSFIQYLQQLTDQQNKDVNQQVSDKANKGRGKKINTQTTTKIETVDDIQQQVIEKQQQRKQIKTMDLEQADPDDQEIKQPPIQKKQIQVKRDDNPEANEPVPIW